MTITETRPTRSTVGRQRYVKQRIDTLLVRFPILGSVTPRCRLKSIPFT